MTIKDKLVELVARNIAKEKYGNTSKSAEFLIDAELLLKQLFLDVLVERSKGDPLDYIEFLECIKHPLPPSAWQVQPRAQRYDRHGAFYH